MIYLDKSFCVVLDGDVVWVGGMELCVLYILGYFFGLVCWYVLELGFGIGIVFSGDMLFVGGLGVIGCLYFDFFMILWLIFGWFGVLLGDIVVYIGYGDSIIIGDEIVYYEEWVVCGY